MVQTPLLHVASTASLVLAPLLVLHGRTGRRTTRQPVPGALALLELLRGRAAVAVVTNNLQAEQEEKLRTLGMAHW